MIRCVELTWTVKWTRFSAIRVLYKYKVSTFFSLSWSN